MAKRDYYEVLGVPRTASEQDLKSAFRSLAWRGGRVDAVRGTGA